MGAPPDEHLPEVVPEQAPEALDKQEAFDHQDQLNEQAPKYLAIYDHAPKYTTPDNAHIEAPYISPINTMTDPNSLMSPTDTIPWEPNSAYDDLNAGERSPINEKEQERTICGLRRKIFFLLLGLTLLIIGGSVGGGVGGGITASNNRAAANAADAQQTGSGGSSSGPAPTLAGSGNGSPSDPAPSPRPSFLNNQTSPKITYQFQAFSGPGYSGNATRVIAAPEEGFIDLPFSAISYVWLQGISSCCVTFCANLTYAGGYWCQDKRQPLASGEFPRIYIGCGKNEQRMMPCS